MSNPGSILSPPRLTKHQGFMLTSASRTGSQNPIAMPGRKPQRHTGRVGFLGSGLLDGQISSPPIESGKRQDQQMSVIGLTNLPVQRPGPASARAGAETSKLNTSRHNSIKDFNLKISEKPFVIGFAPAVGAAQIRGYAASGPVDRRLPEVL